MFSKILIANRGEIACRVMRTARRLGIATVAVYSDADSNAQHRLQADEAVHLPGNLPRETYLVMEKIIAAAKQTGADAIHPGYGFLSENAVFAQACRDAGIAFIGPPPSAIEAMGSKSAAKRLMEEAGVPLVPGYHGQAQDDALLLVEAKRIGFPVLLKAAAGGGGKGMRAVLAESEFAAALAAARREAMNSFGDDQMLVEKYLLQPRHVEVQVFCDRHGNGVYLFERDCSIQRRHQKIVEEAPAPGMTPELRARMGAVAVKAAQAIGYEGAGTIEFLLDADGSFYFMEMNTRLQVEHPVTEFITGQDLVEWQLRVAASETLPLTQAALTIRGHAIEVRICAEDTDHNFLPSTGRLALFRAPVGDPLVRLDTGVVEGDAISPFYDPMIAKLICHGSTREEAAARLAHALRDTRIAGVATNTAYLHRIVSSDAFRAADLDTRFIERHEEALRADSGNLPLALALTACTQAAEHSSAAVRAHAQDPWSPWLAQDAWEPTGPRAQPVALRLGDTMHRLTVTHRARRGTVDGGDLVQYGPQQFDLAVWLDDGHLNWKRDEHRGNAWLHRIADTWHLFMDGEHYALALPTVLAESAEDAAHGCRAPMHGRVVALLVEPGTAVKRGQPLAVMEAMKMEHQITAPADGTVGDFHCAAGDLVDEGTTLLDFEPATTEAAS
ncbi:MAG: acetyl/propionyl/methylcrotonyl-CoA carboxylase subunit alpha [Gammaproteobacteria bacterium]